MIKSALAAMLLASVSASALETAVGPSADGGAEARPASLSHLAALSALRFEANHGQAPKEAHHLARSGAHALLLTSEGAKIMSAGSSGEAEEVARLRFVGAQPAPDIQPEQPYSGNINYLLGPSPEQWRTNIPIYARVRYRELYPSIDVVFRGEGLTLEYDFELSPGAKLADIRVAFEGAKDLKKSADGALIVELAKGTLIQPPPRIFQRKGGETIPIEGGYLLHDDDTVGFEVARYDAQLPLIIDPVLEYSTFLGGQLDDDGLAIAVDADGGAYVTGTTKSLDFPKVGAYQSAFGGGATDAFIVKLTPDGGDIEYATYLGGSQNDIAGAISVDASGSAYIAGTTHSKFDFPNVGAFQSNFGGGASDAFLVKLSPDGSSLNFSTYLGGEGADGANGVAVDHTGTVHVAGFTDSDKAFPLTHPWQSSLLGVRDAFLARFTEHGALAYASYFGGDGKDEATGIAVDGDGHVIVSGVTDSASGFPLWNPLQDALGGKTDGFVAKFSAGDMSPIFATYFGGTRDDRVNGVAAGRDGSVYLSGQTDSSAGFPLKDALQRDHRGRTDGFVARLDAAGALVYSTYFGGAGRDVATGIAVDLAGNAAVAGETDSPALGLPASTDSVWPDLAGQSDAFVLKATANGAGLDYVTYLGGSKRDAATGVAVDFEGNAYVTGRTNSLTDFPIVIGAAQAFASGEGDDAFVAKIRSNTAPYFISSPVTAGRAEQLYFYDANAQDPDGDALFFALIEAPAGMAVDAATGEVTWLPPIEGSFDVILEVQDGQGGAARQEFSIIVIPANEPPEITSQPVTDAIARVLYQYDVEATDPDDDTLTFSLTGEPAGMVIDADSGLISWTPTVSQAGQSSVTVTVNDGREGEDSQTFIVTVIVDLTPPVITLTSPDDGTLTNQAGQTLVGTLSELATLTVNGELVTVEADLSFNHPATLDEGENLISLEATDPAGNTGTASLTLFLDTIPPFLPDAERIQRGVPSGALIPINGNPGSVEDNASVRLTNLATPSSSITVLSDRDGAFGAQIGGINDDLLEIVAIDSAGNVSETLVLGPASPPTLTLDPIGNKLAPLGQTLRFTVTASAPEGQRITLSILPGVLPSGMQFNAQTGEFVFKPIQGQRGSLTLTFIARTLTEEVSETITLTVPAPDPNAPTRFSGRLLDADDLAKGNVRPIVGATVAFLGTGVSTLSDSNGFFNFESVPTGVALVFDINTSTANAAPGGASYAGFREALTLVANVDNIEQRPFTLPRIATESLTQVIPTRTTVVTNSTLETTLTVAPGSAKNADGTPFVGQLSVSLVPQGLAPAALPERLQPDMLITIQPVGVVFDPPAAITFPNTSELTPGTDVDIWSLDPELGQFAVVGIGRVSSDGLRIDTIEGGIRAADWHLPTPQPPNAQGAGDPANPGTCGAGDPFGSSDDDIYTFASSACIGDGRLSVGFSTPAYRSQEQSRNHAFLYQSNRANPLPEIPIIAGISLGSAEACEQEFEVSIAGVDTGFTAIKTRGLGRGNSQRVNLQFNAANLASGMYPYHADVTNVFPRLKIGTDLEGEVMIVNERNSVFGAGWAMRGLFRLGFPPLIQAEEEAEDFIGFLVTGTAGNGGGGVGGGDPGGDPGGEPEGPTPADTGIVLLDPDGAPVNYKPGDVAGEFVAPDADFGTLVENADGTFTHTTKEGIRRDFDSSGLQIRHTDRNGNVTEYVYDIGRLSQIIDPAGLVTQFDYSGGKLRTITDPAGRRTTLSHDASGNLIRVTYPDDSFERYVYQGTLLTERFDERNNRTTYGYDEFSRVRTATLPDGTTRTVASQKSVGMQRLGAPRDEPELLQISSTTGIPSGPVSRIAVWFCEPDPPIRFTGATGDPPGTGSGFKVGNFARVENVKATHLDGNDNKRELVLDNHSRPVRQVDPQGRVTVIERDADSNPFRTTRPNGSVITQTFDASGNLLSRTEEFNSATTSMTYGPFNLVTSITNPRYHTTAFVRDSVGNVEQIRNALNQETLFEYNPQGLVEQIEDANGLVTTFVYTLEGLVGSMTETPPLGGGDPRTTTFAYDPAGNLIETTTPDGVTVAMEYDARGRLTTITDNLNQEIAFTYDDAGNVVQTDTRDPDGRLVRTVTNVFDVRNRLEQTKLPHSETEDSITVLNLDKDSNLIGSIDPNGNGLTNIFDNVNRLNRNIDRAGGSTRFEYDLNDRVTRVEAPNGVTTTFTYDLIGRRLTETSPDRGFLEFEYDKNNNVTAVTDARGIRAEFAYDELDRLTSVTYPNAAENVVFTYDTCPFGVGRLCSRTDESGAYAFSYDGFGNVTQVAFTPPGGPTFTTAYSYDAGDNIVAMTYPSGRQVTYKRDGVQRIEGIEAVVNTSPSTLVSDIQYQADNQVTSRTFANGLIDNREYDLQGRLIDQSLGDGVGFIDARSYLYDKNGNILDIGATAQQSAYGYDALDRLVREALDLDPETAFAYDGNGNRLSRIDLDEDEVYLYASVSNRLRVQETLVTAPIPPPALPERDLFYNDAGRLERLFEGGQLIATYSYNADGLRTKKITAAGTTLFHYDLSGRLIAETDETGQPIRDYLWQGNTPAVQIDVAAGVDTVTYLHSDHLLTARLGTDEFAQIVWRWQGTAFGETQPEELAGIQVNLRFPGQYFDDESNLYYNWNRYYDPGQGRYITSDPVGLDGGRNTFLTVKANPLSAYDITGLLLSFTLNEISRDPIPREDAIKISKISNSLALAGTGTAALGPSMIAGGVQAGSAVMTRIQLRAFKEAVVLEEDLAFISSALTSGSPALSASGLAGFFTTTDPRDFIRIVQDSFVRAFDILENRLKETILSLLCNGSKE